MTTRTTIHKDKHSGNLHVDCNTRNTAVFLHMDCGGFSHCLSLSAAEARLMADALLKGASLIRSSQPAATPTEAP